MIKITNFENIKTKENSVETGAFQFFVLDDLKRKFENLLDRPELSKERTSNEILELLSKLEEKKANLDSADLKYFFKQYKKYLYLLNLKNKRQLLESNNFQEYLNLKKEEYYTNLQEKNTNEENQNQQMQDLIEEIKANVDVLNKIKEIRNLTNKSKGEKEKIVIDSKNIKSREADKAEFQVEKISQRLYILNKELEKYKNKQKEEKSFWKIFNSENNEILKNKLLKIEQKIQNLEAEKKYWKLEAFLSREENAIEKTIEKASKAGKKLYFSRERLFRKDFSQSDLADIYKNYGFLALFLMKNFNLDNLLKYLLLGTNLSLDSKNLAKYAQLKADYQLEKYVNKVKSADIFQSLEKLDLFNFDLKKLSIEELILLLASLEYSKLFNKEKTSQYSYEQIIAVLKEKLEDKEEKLNLNYKDLKNYINEESENYTEELESILKERNLEKHEIDVDLLAFTYLEQKNIISKFINHLLTKAGNLNKGEIVNNNLRDLTVGKGDKENIKMRKTERSVKIQKFLEEHKLLSNKQAIVVYEKGKYKVQYNLGVEGHFFLIEEALRNVLLDIFPEKYLEDEDGFSLLDASRVNVLVYKIKSELKNKNDLIEFDDYYILIKDYEAFSKWVKSLYDQVMQDIRDLNNSWARDLKYQDKNKWIQMIKIKLT